MSNSLHKKAQFVRSTSAMKSVFMSRTEVIMAYHKSSSIHGSEEKNGGAKEDKCSTMMQALELLWLMKR